MNVAFLFALFVVVSTFHFTNSVIGNGHYIYSFTIYLSVL